MTRTVVIAQARMGSSRLPGKVLADLGGKPVVWHCLTRALKIPGIDVVCLATSNLEIDDPLADFVRDVPGVVLCRGHPTDLLSRYGDAAIVTGADIILRMTCDCPLIDPQVCSAVLKLQAETGADYASNNVHREWPHGLDCEVFTREALDQAVQDAVDPYDREHVGPYIRRRAGDLAAHLSGPGGVAARYRWTLDYVEDLQFFRVLWPLLPASGLPNWKDIAAILAANPEIAEINEKHKLALS